MINDNCYAMRTWMHYIYNVYGRLIGLSFIIYHLSPQGRRVFPLSVTILRRNMADITAAMISRQTRTARCMLQISKDCSTMTVPGGV